MGGSRPCARLASPRDDIVAAATMATPTVQQVLASEDETKAAELLFTLLAEQAQGRELSSVVADVAQGVLRGKWSLHIKRLAYDLCKAVPMSDADSQFVITGIRADINSGNPELCALALDMLAHLPPHLLASLLTSGELAQLCSQPLVSDSQVIRAAAVPTLGSVLLVPEVLHAASGSAGMANTVNEHWQTLTDSLLDEDEAVVAAAVTCTTALLKAGVAADVRLPEGYLLERLAAICAARVVAALGAVMHAFSEVTAQSRVETLTLLGLLVEYAVRSKQWTAQDVGGMAGLPTGTLLPGLASLAPTVWGYCSDLLRSGDASVRLEAARTALRVASLVTKPLDPAQETPTQLTDPSINEGVGAIPGSIPQPTGLLLWAVSSVLELEDRVPLVEAAAEDVLGVVVDSLTALPKKERTAVLTQLWGALGRLSNTPARIELCARAWATVVQEDDPAAAGTLDAAAGQLGTLLSDAYISNVLAGKAVVAPSATGSNTNHRQQSPASPTPPPVTASPSGRMNNSTVVAVASTAELTAQASAASDSKSSKSRFFSRKKDPSPAKDVGGEPSFTVGKRDKSVTTTLSQAAEAAVSAVTDLASSITGQEVTKAAPTTISGAHKHELAATLLSVVHTCHPASQLAWQLCADVAQVTAHDQAPSAALFNKYAGWQQQRVLSWVSAARTALQATVGCMQWEPCVVPAITPQVNAPAAQRSPADYSTTVQDLWLQLLQSAAAAARAVQALSKPVAALTGASVPADPPPQLEAQQSVQSEVSAITGTTPGTTPRVGPPLTSLGSIASTTATPSAANPILQAANTETRELTNLSKQILREWASLSRALRARALWVVGHSVDMAPHADELWEHGLKALQDVLCRLVSSGIVSRVTDLLGSAALGVLLKSGRVGWSRDKAFVFDVVAASALCERPDYDSVSLVVGLTVAQAWTIRLQDALGTCTAEASKRVIGDVVFQAGRLEAVLREFMASSDVQNTPTLREWGKRTMKALASTAVFVHPAARALEEAEAAEKAAKEAAEREDKAANGFDPDATIHSSSSSEAGDVGNLLPVSLPTAMYLPPGAARPRPALPPQAPPSAIIAGSAAALEPVLTEQPSLNFATGQLAYPGSPSAQAAGGRDQEPFKARASLLHGPGPAHMVPSCNSAHPWGYPFAPGPRGAALFYSKRSRRSRLLSAHVRKALLRCGVVFSDIQDTGLRGAAALPTHSALRLDSPTFWSFLSDTRPTHTEGELPVTSRVDTIELCGPGDPVMLVGGVMRHSGDASQLVLKITVANRTEMELRGVVVHALAMGPAQLDRRAANWMVPRVSPRDKVSHTFSLKLLGYGLVRLTFRLQLAHGGTGSTATAPIHLPCHPLSVGLVQHMLHPPSSGTPTPQAFFNNWATLPVRVDMSAACVWPGRGGAAAALSAMLRSPLACALLSYVNTTASYQLALAGEVAGGEPVYILVHAQLLPPPVNHSTNVKAVTGSEDAAAATATANGQKQSKESKEASGVQQDAKDKDSAAPGTGNKGAAAAVGHEEAPQEARAQPHALLHICVRSALPDVALALSTKPAEFVQDLTAGSAQLMGPHLACAALGGGAGGPRPPIHPRITALDVVHSASLHALPSAVSGLLGGSSAAMPDVHAQGSKAHSKVSHKFMESVAAAEWQRLVAQPV